MWEYVRMCMGKSVIENGKLDTDAWPLLQQWMAQGHTQRALMRALVMYVCVI